MLASVGTSLWLAGNLRAAPPDLATIKASLDALREGAGFTKFTLIEKKKWLKGCKNRMADPPHAANVAPFLPEEDVVLEAERELVVDYRTGRYRGKGSACLWDIEKDADGTERFIGYLSHSEGAFDGAGFITVRDRNSMHPSQLTPGIAIPREVRVRRLRTTEPEGRTVSDAYPSYLAEGCLPAPDQPITTRERLPPFRPEKWSAPRSITLAGRELTVLVSKPGGSSVSHEYTLRPDLGYVASRFVRYLEGTPTHVIEIEYQPATDRPTVKNWTVQQYPYGERGVLECETIYKVENLTRPASVADSVFTVVPPDGSIAFDLDEMEFYITGDKSQRFDSLLAANEYLAKRNGRDWPWIAGAVIAAVCVIAGLYVTRQRWKFGFRSP
ncbi:MAG: hypothetical protein WD872_19960 [Pirellulaceae bacterium]